MHGDGAQTRSFCFVDDLVEGLIRLMETPDQVTAPINLGNANEFSMIELAQTIIDKTRSTSKIVHLPLPADDPKQRAPDISNAQESLGWRPTVELRAGLERTIRYFRDIVPRRLVEA